MDAALWATVLAAVPLLLALRIYQLLPSTTAATRTRIREQGETCSLGVFLGSGGHTAEMMALVSTLDFARYTPRTYVHCRGDDMSPRLIADLEARRAGDPKAIHHLSLPRARKVGESRLSTLRSALKTLRVALWYTFFKPLLRDPLTPWVDVLLVNGPGTCVVLVAVAWIRRILGLRYTRIIYVESFARVTSLSVSGRLLQPFVDVFIVQWPDAAGRGVALGETGDADAPAEPGEVSRNRVNDRVNGRVRYLGWLI